MAVLFYVARVCAWPKTTSLSRPRVSRRALCEDDRWSGRDAELPVSCSRGVVAVRDVADVAEKRVHEADVLALAFLVQLHFGELEVDRQVRCDDLLRDVLRDLDEVCGAARGPEVREPAHLLDVRIVDREISLVDADPFHAVVALPGFEAGLLLEVLERGLGRIRRRASERHGDDRVLLLDREHVDRADTNLRPGVRLVHLDDRVARHAGAAAAARFGEHVGCRTSSCRGRRHHRG